LVQVQVLVQAQEESSLRVNHCLVEVCLWVRVLLCFTMTPIYCLATDFF
jgi:hypothetical protein